MAAGGKSRDLIGYDGLQQEAMRGVVRSALKRAAAKGLPGDHHFFITFRTGAPGVTGPREVLEQHPEEMMIALQHQFWDLAPGETFFSVTLRFGGLPKSISVPYSAITQFWDPSVDFRLRFNAPEPGAAPAPAPQPAAPAARPPAARAPADASAPQEAAAETPKIVSLDQFRKK